jgi:hypothetical protein
VIANIQVEEVQAQEMPDREKETRQVGIKGMAVHKTSKSCVAVWLFSSVILQFLTALKFQEERV